MIKLIEGSCVDQNVDAIVNAANDRLLSGGGVCGAIFKRAGYYELNKACQEYNVPLKDGDAVITPSVNITNAKYIIHAVGPDFNNTNALLDDLYKAYYNSLIVLKDHNLHSIAFPLISSGIFGGNLDNPIKISTEFCVKAYYEFIKNYPSYDLDVLVCCFSHNEFIEANKIFKK